MTFSEDPEKAPVPEPSAGTDSPIDDEKPEFPVVENHNGGALDKETAVEPIRSGYGDDIERQYVSALTLSVERCL
jgi:hypothetical protein